MAHDTLRTGGPGEPGEPASTADRRATARTPATDPRTPVDRLVIRFCGDSGDGMQLAGGQFSLQSAILGNDIATFPDFPAEIRAPRGSTFGVSAFQVQFAATDILTPGDQVHVLVAMNPAGLKTNLADVEPRGVIIVNDDEFNRVNLRRCGYPEDYDPRDDPALRSRYQFFPVSMSRLTREALAESGLGARDMDRCRNMFALGVVSFLYDRPLEPVIRWIEASFGGKRGRPEIAEANIRVLRSGFHFAETAEIMPPRITVAPAPRQPGRYRQISGNEALAIGLVTAAHKAGTGLFYAGYPITPASDLLHALARLPHLGVITFQAEDEISAVCAAIGASFTGKIAVTGSSGPGITLKSEAIGLAVMYELPLVIVDVQRAGPSTGMPTKMEQADLLLAMFGRAAESPIAVIAAAGPADCFDTAIEAVRLAVHGMCPVMLLSDAGVANGAEPWRIPDPADIAPIPVAHPGPRAADAPPFKPYARDPDSLARPWAVPGTPGLEHRLGGLEKQDISGAVSYDPDNHDRMVRLRAEKISRLAALLPPVEVTGPVTGDVLLLGWGGTYGTIHTAGEVLRAEGHAVATAHLRHLNPFPVNLESVLRGYARVIVPEVNQGQLALLLRARFLIDVESVTETRGRMFTIESLVNRVRGAGNRSTADRSRTP